MSHSTPTGLWPMCGVNPTPPVTYGQYDQRQYVCSDCAAESQRRAEATMAEMERNRAAQKSVGSAIHRTGRPVRWMANSAG